MLRDRSNLIFGLLVVFSLAVAACAPALGGQGAQDSDALEADPGAEEGASAGGEVAGDGDQMVTEDPFEGVRLRFDPRFWPSTDFTNHSVDYSEFLSGGPPPDGIPAIDDPQFDTVDEAGQWLDPDWPVMFFEWNGDARAYPLTILIYHEIVNDVVGGQEVALTFCPLCNATIAFDRTLPDGTILDFGTTGNLRNSDLVMYDRQTFSWWQQFTGEAIVGELTGTVLEFLPSQIIAWSDFAENHPEGRVLSRQTGFSRPYGRNPYEGYDTITSNPFLFDGVADGRLPPVERVAAIQIDGVDVAYPFSLLEELKVVNDEVAGQPVVVFWKEGTVSTFGNSSRDTGASAVFLRQVGERVLTFRAVDGEFEDQETGSTWSVFGEAIAGPLAGSQLTQVVSADHFWFAWAAFRPDTIIWTPPS